MLKFTDITCKPDIGKLFAYGLEIGSFDGQYLRVVIDYKSYLVHRVIWFMTYGDWPETIDHENKDKTDNRISNLRSVTQQENTKNCGMGTNNTSGFTGVYWNKNNKKWIANICVDRKTKYLGSFKLIDEAIARRKAANIEYGFHENHGAIT